LQSIAVTESIQAACLEVMVRAEPAICGAHPSLTFAQQRLQTATGVEAWQLSSSGFFCNTLTDKVFLASGVVLYLCHANWKSRAKSRFLGGCVYYS
jgi:hypothetical protein